MVGSGTELPKRLRPVLLEALSLQDLTELNQPPRDGTWRGRGQGHSGSEPWGRDLRAGVQDGPVHPARTAARGRQRPGGRAPA